MKISRLLRALQPGCRQGNEGIYLGSILYRISVIKLINSNQYVIFSLAEPQDTLCARPSDNRYPFYYTICLWLSEA